jgi:outer membrane protein assembly factor BamB
VRLYSCLADVVARSPFQTSDGIILVGRKTTRVFVLDRHTGTLLRSLSTESVADVDVASEGIAPLTEDAIVIGRADYYVSALDPSTGSLAWNMSR